MYTWNSTAVGHNSMWDLFVSTDSYYPSDQSSYEPFKSNIIQDWAANKISVQAVSKHHVQIIMISFTRFDNHDKDGLHFFALNHSENFNRCTSSFPR